MCEISHYLVQLLQKCGNLIVLCTLTPNNESSTAQYGRQRLLNYEETTVEPTEPTYNEYLLVLIKL